MTKRKKEKPLIGPPPGLRDVAVLNTCANCQHVDAWSLYCTRYKLEYKNVYNKPFLFNCQVRGDKSICDDWKEKTRRRKRP